MERTVKLIADSSGETDFLIVNIINALTLRQTGSQISHSTRLQPKRTVIVIIVTVIFVSRLKNPCGVPQSSIQVPILF